MKILAIDYGTQKIGLAISDLAERIAFPLTVIDNHQAVVFKLLSNLIKQEKIKKIIIGLPKYQQTLKKQTIYREIQQFVKQLKKLFPQIKIQTQDELLTSQAAKRLTASSSSQQKNSHTLAAMIILEDYLMI